MGREFCYRNALQLYLSELGAEVVAESGKASDCYHLGKIILTSLKTHPEWTLQIDAHTKKSESSKSILERSIRCAKSMQRHGVTHGDIVALMAPNHNDLSMPFYAANYLGAAVLPIDAASLIDEITTFFGTANPKMVFCQANKADEVNIALDKVNTKAEIITFDASDKYRCFEDFMNEIDGDVDINGFRATNFDSEDTLCCLIATSGTTGSPKVTSLTHKTFFLGITQFWSTYTKFPMYEYLKAFAVATLQWYTGVYLYYASAIFGFTRVQSSGPPSSEHYMEMIQQYKAKDTPLAAGDLILLYQNLELGTQLVTSSHARHNQHVESIVYAEDTDSFSDTSVISTEDIFDINNERLDLLTQPTNSYNLSHKYGDLRLQTQNLSHEYNNHEIFNDTFIKEQLMNMNTMKKQFDTNTLPTSLLDYVCCKRLEDNYNYYMDSIINYVKNTIDQLQRISNGDFLTDKAKKKWKEVNDISATALSLVNDYQLVSSQQLIPLFEGQNITRSTLWDEIVHSEVDFKTLSKILEKKIIIELPTTICSQFKFLSQYCSENLILNCKDENAHKGDRTESKPVDVVVHVNKPTVGEDVKNSILMLNSPGSEKLPEPVNEDLSLPCIEYHNDCELDGNIIDQSHSELDCMVYIHNNITTSDEELIELPKPAIEPPKSIYATPRNNESKTDIKATEHTNQINQSNNKETIAYDDRCAIQHPDIGDEFEMAMDESVSETQDYVSENLDFVSESQEYVSETLECASDNEESVSDNQECGSENQEYGSNNQDCVSDNGYNTSNSNDEEAYDFRTSDSELIMITEDDQMPSTENPDDAPKKEIMVSVQEVIEDGNSNVGVKKSLAKSNATLKTKSPYDNKTYFIEEKRRRKLLAIRERREKRKLSVQEAKTFPNKKSKLQSSTKNSIPQSSNSVTKLSITNKSFYNSIFGHSSSTSSKKHTKQDVILEIPQEYDFDEDEQCNTALTSGDRKEYINKSYYLDDTDTAVSHMETKNEDADGLSMHSDGYYENDSRYLKNLNIFMKDRLLERNSTTISLPGESKKSSQECHSLTEITYPEKVELTPIDLLDLAFKSPKTPRAPKPSPVTLDEENIESTPGDCRKSIKKVYSLLKRLSNKKKPVQDVPEKHGLDNKDDFMEWNIYDDDCHKDLVRVIENSVMTDNNGLDTEQMENTLSQSTNIKISTKRSRASQKMLSEGAKKSEKNDSNDQLRRKKKIDKPGDNIHENPLKVLSHILSEIDNAQKKVKKNEVKTARHRSENKSPVKEAKKVKPEVVSLHNSPEKNLNKEKHQVKQLDRNFKDKDMTNPKKKIADFIDEAKEARGEAVKGPRSRLDALALPRKTYVQAHSEEYQNKYGRNLMSDRLQRLAKGINRQSPRGTSDKSVLTPTILQKIGRKKDLPIQSNLGLVQPAAPVNINEHGPRAFRRVIKETTPKSSRNNEPVKLGVLKNDNKKKMEAVESYVQNHYGPYGAESPETKCGQQQRVKRPHVIFIENNQVQSEPTDSASKSDEMTEWPSETCVKNCLSDVMDGDTILENPNEDVDEVPDNRNQMSKYVNNTASVPSVFADRTIKTAVGELSKCSHSNITSEWDSEIERLENALCTHVTTGKFSKRLRLKSITLTPKHSLKRMMILKPQDAASLLLRNSSSKSLNLKHPPTLSASDDKMDLRKTPSLSLGFQFPMQISTIGYVLTQHGTDQDGVFTNDAPSIIINAVEAPDSSEADKSSSDDLDTVLQELREPTIKEDQGESTSKPTNIEQTSDTTKVTVDTETSKSLLDMSSENYAQTDFTTNTNMNPINDDVDQSIPQAANSSPSNIVCTSSLDILVGLLNEIKNITCQNTLTSAENNNTEVKTEKVIDSYDYTDAKYRSKSLLDVTNEQTKVQTSMYSLFVTGKRTEDDDSQVQIPELEEVSRDNMLDKEISAHIMEKCSLRDFSTGISTQQLPLNTTTQSTSVRFHVTSESINVTDSVIGIFSEPSDHSVVLLHRGQSAMETLNRIINLNSDIDITHRERTVDKISNNIVSNDSAYTRNKNDTDGAVKQVSHEPATNTKSDNREKISANGDHMSLCSKSTTSPDDGNMKLKRDVLVTVYSLLVLTIFAALSFPEVMLHS